MDGSLPGSTAPFQKPAGMMRCKRLILRRRNWPVLPFQKQVFLGDAGHLVGGRQQVLRAFNRWSPLMVLVGLVHANELY
jgi:hypothetical protein